LRATITQLVARYQKIRLSSELHSVCQAFQNSQLSLK
jgi:hypothetical protein